MSLRNEVGVAGELVAAVLTLITCAGFFFFGYIFGASGEAAKYQREAIERGYGERVMPDPNAYRTEWRWKEKP